MNRINITQKKKQKQGSVEIKGGKEDAGKGKNELGCVSAKIIELVLEELFKLLKVIG